MKLRNASTGMLLKIVQRKI